MKRAGCQRKRAGGSTLLNRPRQITVYAMYLNGIVVVIRIIVSATIVVVTLSLWSLSIIKLNSTILFARWRYLHLVLYTNKVCPV